MQNVTREIALEEDEAATGWRGLAMLVLISVAAHAALFGGLGGTWHRGEAKPRKRPPTEMTVTVKPPPPAPPPPETKPAPKTAQKIAARAPAPPPPDAPPPPPPEAETPADFSGTTLTNDGPGDGWASAVGNGEAMRGPIGRPGAKVTGRARDGAAEPSPVKSAPVVALASLSRPPAPPDLNDALERHYPDAARKQGTPGQAVLKARITARGPGARSGRRVAERRRVRRCLPRNAARVDLERAARPRRPAGGDVRQLHLPVRGSMIAQGGLPG